MVNWRRSRCACAVQTRRLPEGHAIPQEKSPHMHGGWSTRTAGRNSRAPEKEGGGEVGGGVDRVLGRGNLGG